MMRILIIAENAMNPFGEMVGVEEEDQAQDFAMELKFQDLVVFNLYFKSHS
jgi:hypothetical protein